MQVNKGEQDNVELEIKDFEYGMYPVKKEDKDKIDVQIDCDYFLEAPVYDGEKVGEMHVAIGENEVLNYDIVNTIDIEKKNCDDYFLEILSNFFKYLTIEI